MARQQGAVGPSQCGVDEVGYGRLRRRVLWKMPSGLYLLGSRDGEARNLMTCNWVTQLATEPKLLGVSVEVGAHTHELIRSGGCYTLCVLDRGDRAVVRKFVKPAEDDRGAMTLNGFPYRDSAVTGAPILEIARASLDCRLRQHIELGSHALFIGEIVDAHFASGEDFPVLRMEDTRMSYGG